MKGSPQGNTLIVAVAIAVVVAALLLIFTKPNSSSTADSPSAPQLVIPGSESGNELEVEDGIVIEESEPVLDDSGVDLNEVETSGEAEDPDATVSNEEAPRY